MTITRRTPGVESGKTAGANPTPGFVAGVALGDYLTILCAGSTSTVFGTGAISGWNRLYALQSAATAPTGNYFWKIADAGDVTASGAGSTVTVTSPGGLTSAKMFAYVGVDQVNPHDTTPAFVSDGWSTARSNFDLPAITPVTDHCCLIAHAWSNALTGAFTPPSADGGYTEQWDSSTGGTTNVQTMADLLDWTPAGVTSIRNFVRTGGTSKGGVAGVALRPAGTGPKFKFGTGTHSTLATKVKTLVGGVWTPV